MCHILLTAETCTTVRMLQRLVRIAQVKQGQELVILNSRVLLRNLNSRESCLRQSHGTVRMLDSLVRIAQVFSSSVLLSSLELSDTQVYEPYIRALLGTAQGLSTRRGISLKGFHLRAKARIWPGLSDMCHIRSTAETQPAGRAFESLVRIAQVLYLV